VTINNEKAWLARLLHNLCVDLHRSNRRRLDHMDRVREIQEIESSAAIQARKSPEEALLNGELARKMDAAITSLPTKLRAPLTMRLVNGESYPEIAERLELSNENARKRVQQARALLRERLRAYNPVMERTRGSRS
jgi:RNA polymerase sigma-70 factor (ECF subfamily)